MIKLFQIGDTPIHFHQQKWPGWDIKGRGKTSDAIWSHEFFPQSRQFQPDQQSYKIQSIVIDEDGLTARQQVERLKQMVDFPTTVIAYDLHSSGDMDSCFCQAHGLQDVMWYTNVGVLNSISEDAGSQNEIEVTLTITLNAYWTALNRYLWSWQGGDFDPMYPPPVSTPYANFISKYPNMLDGYGVNHWSRRPVDRWIAYDPDLWGKLHLNTGLSFHTGVGSSWGGTYHMVVADETEWSAPPMSVYAFKGLPNVGTLEMRINRLQGVFERVQESTTVDLALLDARLLAVGLAGLQTTDILYMGDCYPKPGFLLRGGNVIDITLPITYPGRWPGQISIGRSGVQLQYPTTGSPQMAYLHSFRRT